MRALSCALALSCLAVAACANTAPAGDAGRQSPPQAAAVEAYCGGGVTGGGEGVTITAEDHVVSWRKPTAGGARTDTDLGVDPAFAADVRRQLETIRFADITYAVPGNMTCGLRSGGHDVFWPQGDPNAPQGAVSVQELVFGADGRE